ncbi:hypothetical protein Hanom_Chr11g00997771 [Helianthus anomalus]
MTSVEEILINCNNYLTLGLENNFQEINLLHKRLNILAMPPMEPIFPQEDWNLAQEVVNPTGWGDLLQPPQNNLHEVPVTVAPPPQNVLDDKPILLSSRD